MEQVKIPPEELAGRRQRLQRLMREQGLGGALIVQRADLYYFSGTAQEGHLFIPVEGEPRLLVRRSLERARSESSLRQIYPFAGWDDLAATVKEMSAPGAPVGLELDVLPVNIFRRYEKIIAPLEAADVSPLVRSVRAVKSPYELEQLQRAAALGEAVFNHARKICREGMREIELAAALEAFARASGHQGAVRMRGFNQELFFSHTMAGASAAVPSFFNGPTGGRGLNLSYPQGAGFRRIERGEPILIDFVTVLNGYMVDQTRVFCLGRPAEKLQRAYETALQIKEALAELGREGVVAADLYRRAEEMAAAAGLAEHFMGAAEKVYFVGHGVGLELDELPVIARSSHAALAEGMVVALEPKFVFPGDGTVGIEDTFVVHRRGLEQITRFDDSLQIL